MAIGRSAMAGSCCSEVARIIRDRIREVTGLKVSAGISYCKFLFSRDPAKAEIDALAVKVWRSCEVGELTGRTVTLKVKYADFQQIIRSRTVERGVRDMVELTSIASALLEQLCSVEKGIRLLGVTLSSLEPRGKNGGEE